MQLGVRRWVPGGPHQLTSPPAGSQLLSRLALLALRQCRPRAPRAPVFPRSLPLPFLSLTQQNHVTYPGLSQSCSGETGPGQPGRGDPPHWGGFLGLGEEDGRGSRSGGDKREAGRKEMPHRPARPPELLLVSQRSASVASGSWQVPRSRGGRNQGVLHCTSRSPLSP